jgi:DNA end-binding protein Ku
MDNNQAISRAEVLHGYEFEPDRYVVFDREEIRSLQRRASPHMEILRSVRLSEIDPVFLETSYYVAPERGDEKAYAILFEALRTTQHVALARVGMHGREHVVIIRPGGQGIVAHTMFYTDEIRFENEFRAKVESVGPKELEVAKTFLEAIEAPFSPEEFKDLYREDLQAMIMKKIADADPARAGGSSMRATLTVDMLEALKRSIGMKHEQSPEEIPPTRKAAQKVTEIQSKRPPEAQ